MGTGPTKRHRHDGGGQAALTSDPARRVLPSWVIQIGVPGPSTYHAALYVARQGALCRVWPERAVPPAFLPHAARSVAEALRHGRR